MTTVADMSMSIIVDMSMPTIVNTEIDHSGFPPPARGDD
jgi:hypothetical protein